MTLRLRNLDFSYREAVPVIASLSLEVKRGELVMLLGPNGSGKSTLLRLAAGLLPARKGSVEWDGRELRDYSRRERARRIAFLPQQVESIHVHTVRETVGLGRHPYLGSWGRPGEEDLKEVELAMQRTEVTALASRTLDELSGGERQRVHLAAALAQGGDLLLLDEPTVSLDLHHQVRFLSLLELLAREGRAVFCATHDLNLAAAFASRVVLLHHGESVAEGKPADVLKEELLREVYGDGLWVGAHPAGDRVVVLPSIARGREES
jgi:iron complex transport system ATP-binding protein